MNSDSKAQPGLVIQRGQIETLSGRMTVRYDWIIHDFVVRWNEVVEYPLPLDLNSASFIAGHEIQKPCEWKAILSARNQRICLGIKLMKCIFGDSQSENQPQPQPYPNIACRLTGSIFYTDGTIMFHQVGSVERFTYTNRVMFILMNQDKDVISDAPCYTHNGDFHCRIEMEMYGERITRNIPQSISWSTSPTHQIPISDVDNMMEDFGKLMTDEASSDVVIKCGDQSFPAHKIILSARSPVFAAMFRHATEECKLDEVDPEIVSILLKFIYTGKLDELNEEQMVSVVQAANKYGLVRLKDYYMDVLSMRITQENFSTMAILSYLHNGGELMKGNLKAFYLLNKAFVIWCPEFRKMVGRHPDFLKELD